MIKKQQKNNILILCFLLIFLFTGCEKTNNYREITSETTSEITINSETELTTDFAYIYFIDVGQGDCILIDYNEYEILIDGGNNGYGDTVSEFLKDKVDGNLEIIIATHPHSDHIGGLDTVLENYTVDVIIDSGTYHSTTTYQDYIDAVSEEDATYMTDDDMVFNIDENVVFTVIDLEDNLKEINNNSVITMLDIGGVNFLFTGDLESEMEIEYLHKFEETDVLKVAHHGSDTSTSTEFIEKVKPSFAIISCGVDNKYNHPTPQTLVTLSENNIATYRTDVHGTVTVKTDGDIISFKTSENSIDNPLTQSSDAPVESNNAVYITKTGSKYHNKNCQYLKQSSIAIELEDATKNYEPCSVCF